MSALPALVSDGRLEQDLCNPSEPQGVSVVRDKAWPKSARWLWRRIKEVLPSLVAAGIEASREHTDKGTTIALCKIPRDDVSNVREGEAGKDKVQSADVRELLLSGSNVRDGSNVRANVSPKAFNQAGSEGTDNTDNRNEDPWQNDPMRHYRRGG